MYMPAGTVPLVCSRARGCPCTPPELLEGSGGHPSTAKQPRSTPTVRLPSTAALPRYSHHTDPSTATRTPVIPVHSLLRRHVPSMTTSLISPRHPNYTHRTVHLTTAPSLSPIDTSPLPGPSCSSPNSLLRSQDQGASHPTHCSAGGAVARPHADPSTLGVTRGTTFVTAVTRPPVETPVSWEYPTGVWALLPWLGRPMTPHWCMRRPGAGG